MDNNCGKKSVRVHFAEAEKGYTARTTTSEERVPPPRHRPALSFSTTASPPAATSRAATAAVEYGEARRNAEKVCEIAVAAETEPQPLDAWDRLKLLEDPLSSSRGAVGAVPKEVAAGGGRIRIHGGITHGNVTLPKAKYNFVVAVPHAANVAALDTASAAGGRGMARGGPTAETPVAHGTRRPKRGSLSRTGSVASIVAAAEASGAISGPHGGRDTSKLRRASLSRQSAASISVCHNSLVGRGGSGGRAADLRLGEHRDSIASISSAYRHDFNAGSRRSSIVSEIMDPPKRLGVLGTTPAKLVRLGYLLPPEEPASYCAQCWNRCIIMPNSNVRTMWDIVIVFLLLYTLVFMPLLLAFETDEDGWLYADGLVEILFICDIFVTFISAYYSEDRMFIITDHFLIARRYLRSWFLLDLIATFPYNIVLSASVGRLGSTAKIPRLIRFVRLLRFLKFFKIYTTDGVFTETDIASRFSPSFLRIGKLLCVALSVAHFAACIWIFIGRQSDDSEAWMLRVWGTDPASQVELREDAYLYLVGLYWALTTLTTVGYGDITPESEGEIVCALVMMISGTTFFAYTAASVSSIIQQADAGSSHFREKMADLKQFMTKTNLPGNLQLRLVNQLGYTWRQPEYYHHKLDWRKLMKEVPDQLRQEITWELHKSILTKSPWFLEVRQYGQFVTEIANALRPQEFSQHTTMATKGQVVTDWFIIDTGVVQAVKILEVVVEPEQPRLRAASSAARKGGAVLTGTDSQGVSSLGETGERKGNSSKRRLKNVSNRFGGLEIMRKRRAEILRQIQLRDASERKIHENRQAGQFGDVRRAKTMPPVVARASGTDNDTPAEVSVRWSPSHRELMMFARALRRNVQMKDRRYRFRMYKDCFLGEEAIDWMLEAGIVTDVVDGERLGQMLMVNGLVDHCVSQHSFRDKAYLYQFLPLLDLKSNKMGFKEEFDEATHLAIVSEEEKKEWKTLLLAVRHNVTAEKLRSGTLATTAIDGKPSRSQEAALDEHEQSGRARTRTASSSRVHFSGVGLQPPGASFGGDRNSIMLDNIAEENRRDASCEKRRCQHDGCVGIISATHIRDGEENGGTCYGNDEADSDIANASPVASRGRLSSFPSAAWKTMSRPLGYLGSKITSGVKRVSPFSHSREETANEPTRGYDPEQMNLALPGTHRGHLDGAPRTGRNRRAAVEEAKSWSDLYSHRQKIFYTLSDGDTLGEVGIFLTHTWMTDMRALTHVRSYTLPKTTFLEIIQKVSLLPDGMGVRETISEMAFERWTMLQENFPGEFDVNPDALKCALQDSGINLAADRLKQMNVGTLDELLSGGTSVVERRIQAVEERTDAMMSLLQTIAKDLNALKEQEPDGSYGLTESEGDRVRRCESRGSGDRGGSVHGRSQSGDAIVTGKKHPALSAKLMERDIQSSDSAVLPRSARRLRRSAVRRQKSSPVEVGGGDDGPAPANAATSGKKWKHAIQDVRRSNFVKALESTKGRPLSRLELLALHVQKTRTGETKSSSPKLTRTSSTGGHVGSSRQHRSTPDRGSRSPESVRSRGSSGRRPIPLSIPPPAAAATAVISASSASGAANDEDEEVYA